MTDHCSLWLPSCPGIHGWRAATLHTLGLAVIHFALYIILMLVLPMVLYSQQAVNVSVRHVVDSREGGIGLDPANAWDGTVGICVARDLGILRTTDTYYNLHAVLAPSDGAFYADYYDCANIYAGCFLAAGSYYDRISRRAMISRDGGLTWEQHPDLLGYSGGSGGAMQFLGDAYGRFSMNFTMDSAETFTEIYFSDSLPVINDLNNFRYLGNGRFVIRYNALKRWYQVDIAGDRYVETNIPGELWDVYRTTDGSIVGIERRDRRTVFRIQTVPDGPFDDITYRDADGNPLDSFYMSSVNQIDGGALLCMLDGWKRNLLAVTGTDAWLVPLDGHIANAVAWGRVLCSHKNRSCVTLTDASGRDLGMVLVDVDKRTVRTLPSGPIDDFDFDLLTDSVVVDLRRGQGSVVIYNLHTNEIELGGTVHDPYNRQLPIGVDKGVMVGGKIIFVDDVGDVFHFDDHARSMLLRQRATGRSARYEDFYNKSLSMPAGTNFIWADSNTIVSGGTRLQRTTIDGTATLVRADSTCCWLRTSWGDEFAGHRVLCHRTDAMGFDTLPTPWSSSIVIGHLLESRNHSLIAGLRGYRRIKNLEPQDTLHGGLWRSQDSGRTWSQITLPVAGQMILALEQRESDGSLWATVSDVYRSGTTEVDSTGAEKETTYSATINNLHLIRSDDNGATWSVVTTLPMNIGWRATISNAAFYGQSTVAWAALDRVYWSDDNGQSWRLVEGLPGGAFVVSHVMFDDAGNLWLSTSGGIYTVPSTHVSVDDDGAGGQPGTVHDPKVTHTPIFWAETFPNPSGRTITLRLHNLDRLRGDVATLRIVDIMGRTVLDLKQYTHGERPPGTVDIPIDLGTETPGVYMLVAQAHGRSFTWPMCVTKQ